MNHAEAEVFVQKVVAAFNTFPEHRSVDSIVNAFTPDAVAQLGYVPEIRGHAQLKDLFEKRLARQTQYRLHKTLRGVLEGDVLVVQYHGEWVDAITKQPMGWRGIELWTLREGKIAKWELAFNVTEPEGTRPAIM